MEGIGSQPSCRVTHVGSVVKGVRAVGVAPPEAVPFAVLVVSRQVVLREISVNQHMRVLDDLLWQLVEGLLEVFLRQLIGVERAGREFFVQRRPKGERKFTVRVGAVGRVGRFVVEAAVNLVAPPKVVAVHVSAGREELVRMTAWVSGSLSQW